MADDPDTPVHTPVPSLAAVLRARARGLRPLEQPSRWTSRAELPLSVPAVSKQRHRISYRGLPSTRGILPEDILEGIFTILREDERQYWEYHHHFPNDERSLAACALVSRLWKSLSQRHLYRDLVYTRGRIVKGACEIAGHQAALCDPLCNCFCHLSLEQQLRIPPKRLESFLHFLREAPHLRRYVRSLRLRTSPLDVRECPVDIIQAGIVLDILGMLSNAKDLHLEDIALTPRPVSIPSQAKISSLESLTLSSCEGLTYAQASRTLDTLSHFDQVTKLRLVHLWDRRTDINPSQDSAIIFMSSLKVGTIELERTKFMGDDLYAFLVNSAESHITVRTTLPTDRFSALRLRRFIDRLGPRLEHLEYSLRVRDVSCPATLLLAAVMASPPDPATGGSLDLSGCTRLRTLRLSLALDPGTLALDLNLAVIPTLASLRGLGSEAEPLELTLAVALGEVLETLPVAAGTPSRCALARLEDAVAELHGLGRVSNALIELEIPPTPEDIPRPDDRVARANHVLKALFPRLDARGSLVVATAAKASPPRVNAFWGGRYDAPW